MHRCTDKLLDVLVANLTFIGPRIVIYLCSKTNQMHQCLKFILLE